MVFKPSGPISFTKTTLSYPVYTVDFDPYNRGYLVVAGGGGEGRSGVGNKIVMTACMVMTSWMLTASIRQSWTRHHEEH